MRTPSRIETRRAVVGGLAALCVMGGALIGAPATLATTAVVTEPTDGVNGVVYASMHMGDRTFIGGSFSWAGPSTGSGVPVDAATGKRLSMPRVNGLVRAAVADGAGGWYVGGDFVYSGGKIRNGAARINARGTTTAWAPQPNGPVHALAVINGVVYIGGSFTEIGGQSRSNVAAVDAQSGALLSWNPGASGPVSALTVSPDGQTVYAGGSFISLGGQARANLGAIDAATGTATSWDPNVDGPVADIEVRGSVVYVGGSFASVGGAARSNLVALAASNGSATSWARRPTGPSRISRRPPTRCMPVEASPHSTACLETMRLHSVSQPANRHRGALPSTVP